MTTVFVVDTGYLLALFRVPGYATAAEEQEVFNRFDAATDSGHERLVPVAVIYELARHVAQIGGNARQ
ncbi:MAG: hypothetical protein H6747_05685 [Deltaproteobacteria bacterium]|nr:hypothetical protein [Deltaproteobacteria bacterium]